MSLTKLNPFFLVIYPNNKTLKQFSSIIKLHGEETVSIIKNHKSLTKVHPL